jgi:hypothetical protein
MSRVAQEKTFGAYMNEVIQEHVVAEDEEQVILDVTPKEAEELGLFFIRVTVGWWRGLKRVRVLRQWVEAEAANGRAAIEEGEIADEEESEKELVN